jgi:hypothetical protein
MELHHPFLMFVLANIHIKNTRNIRKGGHYIEMGQNNKFVIQFEASSEHDFPVHNTEVLY